MKKIIVVGLVTLGTLTLGLQAYDKTERRQDMQTMEVAMGQIQKGILSNNEKMALQGIENLKTSSSQVEIAPKKKDMDYTATYAKKQGDNIIFFADKIKENLEAGRKHSAAKNYTEVLGQCISCHNKLRKWN